MVNTNTTKSFKKGFKFRIYPTEEQAQFLNQAFGANRFLWNHVLAQKKKEYFDYLQAKQNTTDSSLSKPNFNGYHLSGLLPFIKEEFPWMKAYSNVSYQQTLFDLADAYSRFLKSPKTVGHPKFKKKNNKQSLKLTLSGFTLRNDIFKVARLKSPLKVVWSQKLPSPPSSCVVSLTPTGKFYVSFLCDFSPKKTSGSLTTGIDFGITNIATLSNGEKIGNPRHYLLSQKKIKRLNQRHSKAKKGSKNSEKARKRLALCHSRIADQRRDYLHKLSRRLVNENQVLGIESLSIENMSKNRKLSKHLMTSGWAEFVRQLLYKSAESQRCFVVMVHRFFPSSHLCSETGKHLGRKLTLGERHWECPHCQKNHDRDVNAAKVIAKEAIRQLNNMGWPDHYQHDGKFLAGSRYTPVT